MASKSYRTIGLSEVTALAPMTAELWYAVAYNPVAIAEGAPDAVRNYVGSLERIAAGAVLRAEYTASNTKNADTEDYAVAAEFPMLQSGSVRIAFDHRTDSGSDSQARVRRIRAGAETTMDSWLTSSTSHVNRSVDFSVMPFDLIRIEHRPEDGDPGISTVDNMQLLTNGEDFWGIGNCGYVTGNRAIE